MTIHICPKCEKDSSRVNISIKHTSKGTWERITRSAYVALLKERGGQVGNLFHGELCPFHISEVLGHLGVRVVGE